jgi:hypothetical protein
VNAPQPDSAFAMTEGAAFSTAIVTPSYRADFERCRLLCETMDAHVRGFTRHLILVAPGDIALFRPLEGQGREVVDERDILPTWMRSFPDPFTGRRIWAGPGIALLRGWHVQQLRRIAIARHVNEAALVYCDSDVAFLKDFDCTAMWQNGRLRLFRREHGLARRPDLTDQRRWSAHAAAVLALPSDRRNDHDYVGTLIAWRRQTVLAMMAHIEAAHGRHWVKVLAARRAFSECMLYGRFVDDLLEGVDHFHDNHELCHVFWNGEVPDAETLAAFLERMAPGQVAVGIQSFLGADIKQIRSLLAGKF